MTTRSTTSTKRKQTKYASGTMVSIAKSREEIEKLLMQYNASGFAYGNHGATAVILFEMQGRRYRLELNYPSLESFRWTKSHVMRNKEQMENAADQEIRRLWRALKLVIQAKLEAVQSGITTIEKEFLGNTVMPNNQTIQEWMEPQVNEMYRTHQMPPMLSGLSGTGSPKQLPEASYADAPDIIEGDYEES